MATLHPILRVLLYLSLQAPILMLGSTAIKRLGLRLGLARGTPQALQYSLAVQAVLIACVLGPAWLVLHYLNGYPLSALGFGFERPWLSELSAGFGLGVGGSAVVGSALLLSGSLRLQGFNRKGANGILYFLLQALALLLVAVFEEALFRGYFFQEIGRWLGQAVPLLLTALIFGGLHGLLNKKGTLIGALATGLAGATLYLAFMETTGLWLSAGIHWGWNVGVGLLFSCRLSGELLDGRLFKSSLTAPQWLAGGDFGPEAGLPAVFAYLLLALGIIWLF